VYGKSEKNVEKGRKLKLLEILELLDFYNKKRYNVTKDRRSERG